MDRRRNRDSDGSDWAARTASSGDDESSRESDSTSEKTDSSNAQSRRDEQASPTKRRSVRADPRPPKGERPARAPPRKDPRDERETRAKSSPGEPANKDGEDPVANMLSERIEENKQLKDENEQLRAELEELREAREEERETINGLEEQVERLQQEMRSLKQRGKKREANAKQNALRDVVSSMTKVRDTLQRAVEQDEDVDIRDGVETTLTQFDKTLEEFGVELVEPVPGDDVDPERHEVMQKLTSDQPEGTIVETFSVGYENDDGIIKTAQVIVSDGPAAADE